MCVAKIVSNTHQDELNFGVWHQINMQSVLTKSQLWNVIQQYFMNCSELPLADQLPHVISRWGFRGSWNDLAEHRLKKPNESCLSGLGKAAAPWNMDIFSKIESLHVTLQSGVGEGFCEHIRRLKSPNQMFIPKQPFLMVLTNSVIDYEERLAFLSLNWVSDHSKCTCRIIVDCDGDIIPFLF